MKIKSILTVLFVALIVVVVRQNRDTQYSKGVFDTKGGCYFELPILETYQSLQIIDEYHRTIAVLYAEEGKNKATITPDMLSFGQHVWCIVRTQVESLAEEHVQKAREKQALVIARPSSSKPYTAKGFDQLSRERTRLEQEKLIPKADWRKAFDGPKLERIDKWHATVGTSIGYGGLPSEDAWYVILFAEDPSGAPQTMTFRAPPLRDKGFISIATNGPDAYIHAYNFSLGSRKGELVPNEDGFYTVNFNRPGEINNIDVVEKWTGVLRMYGS
jgi:hypothetical protein